MFATAFILFSCNSPQTKRGEIAMSDTDTAITPITKDTVNSIKEDWNSFKAKEDQKIKATDDSLYALKQKIDVADKETSAKIDEEIARLQEKNHELKSKLETYKDEGAEKWQKFKYDFDNDMDSVAVKWKALTKEKS